MKDRIVLINIILALLNQSYGSNKNISLVDVSKEAMDLVKTPHNTGGGNDEFSLLVQLKELILDLLHEGTKEPIDIRGLNSKMRVMGIYFKDVVKLIETETSDMESKGPELADKDYYRFHKDIITFVRESKFSEIMTRYSFKLKNDPSQLKNRDMVVKELNDELAPYLGSDVGASYTDIPGVISAIDLNDRDVLREVYEQTQDLHSSCGKLLTDLQGWNQLLGGGFVRGELIEIQAFSGMGKSDTIRKLIGGIAVSNEPHMIDTKKKPLVLILTIEDTQRECYEKFFTNFYREEFNIMAKVSDFSPDEIIDYVQSKFQARGYHFKIVEAAKHQMSPYDVISLLEAIGRDGYEIHAFGLDYMLLLNINNVPGTMDTYKVKNSYGIIGAYTKPRGITTITAAQIDDSAKYLLEDSEEFARDAVSRNFSAGSKYIIHELDMRLFVHIVETADGTTYHQLAKGKHRANKSVPARLKYAVYEMHNIDGIPAGYIRSDMVGESQVRDSTGGQTRAKGGGIAF